MSLLEGSHLEVSSVMGVPLLVIHFRLGFSVVNHHFSDIHHFQETPIYKRDKPKNDLGNCWLVEYEPLGKWDDPPSAPVVRHCYGNRWISINFSAENDVLNSKFETTFFWGILNHGVLASRVSSLVIWHCNGKLPSYSHETRCVSKANSWFVGGYT